MLLIDSQTEAKTSEFFSRYLGDLFVKKRKLVKLEIDFITQVRSQWEKILVDYVTDRAKAAAAITACYEGMGLQRPNIIWAENPLHVLKILINRLDFENIAPMIVDRVWNSSELEIQHTIDPGSTALVVETLKHKQGEFGVNIHQINTVADRMNEIIFDQIARVYSEISQHNLPSPLQDYRIADLSYLDYFMRIGVNIPQVKPMVDLAQSCGWCWTFQKVAILTPKPTQIEIDRDGKVIEIIYDGLNILDI